MATLTIRRGKSDGYEPFRVELLLDGKPMASGGIGGEDEDNCEARDYAWVLPAFKKLATRLGANVAVIETDDDEDD
jgi:hypothetical protein